MKKLQIVFNILTILLTCFALAITFNIPKKFGYIRKLSTPSVRPFKIMNNLRVKQPIVEQKSFVVVITSYNNETICEKNLFSVFQQTYKNYRIIFIDDCSKDATFEKVEALTKALNQESRVTLIRNSERNLKLANLYPAYMSCKDSEIIVCLDGDDWFAHENVLKELNHYYQNPNVWITYGSAINHPNYDKKDGAPISDKILQANSIRKNPFEFSMLRSFYAGLFKKIKLKDLLYQGRFLPSADDFAFMVPMVEMAPTHTLFIPDILYIINDSNPLRESLTIESLQHKLMKHLKLKEKYEPLELPFDPRNIESEVLKESLDLIILSNGEIDKTEKALNNYLSYFTPLHNVYVLFKGSSPEKGNEYQNLIDKFPSVSFIHETTLSLKSIVENTSTYVAIATDSMLLTSPLNGILSVKELELTGAINFLIGPNTPPTTLARLNESVVAASFETIVKSPNISTTCFFSIFQQKFLKKALLPNKSLLNSVYVKDKNLSETTLFYKEPLARISSQN
jgi:glycosyltransferase involved in cell wall biosynthesis